MKIIYMKKDPEVDPKCLMEAHGITKAQLDNYIKNAKDNKFTIDDITYTLELDKLERQKHRCKYSCSNGKVKHINQPMKRISEIIEKNVSTVSYHMSFHDSHQFGKWLVEREL